MSRTFEFAEKKEFLAKQRELRRQGYSRADIELILPWPVPEVDEVLDLGPGAMRFFSLAGGTGGFVGGIALTTLTVLSWPMITGGKPIISWPPFLLIAYLLTILFGSVFTFVGFLLLTRRPSLQGMVEPEAPANRFLIVLKEEEEG